MAKESIEITLTVNGHTHTVQTLPERRLLDILRDDLHLTGAKEGCGCGECGACTVIMNDELVNSCLVPAFQADGVSVTTVEGLGTPDEPNAVQAAFAQEHATQCGYCIPGMVVSVTHMLKHHPEVSREEARKILSGNICRCTGYHQILNAVERAKSGVTRVSIEGDGVGVSTPRIDGLEKACGTLLYAADLTCPEGVVHGVTVRSDVVHARLLEIRSEEALRVPGVLCVLTHQDVPGELYYGNAAPDQPVLAKDHIRFYGEAIAVVIAESLEAAQEGARRVTVVTEDLPLVLDPEAALLPDAPKVHDNGNLCVHHRLHKGDPDTAFTSAEYVLEREYRTPSQEHVCLESEVALAYPRSDGGLTLKAPSQNVFFDRLHIANTLGLEKNKVHMIQTPTGAAFGSREDVYAHIHAGLGALKTRRPCRIVWTREESQIATVKRHPAICRYSVAFRGDGKLLALKAAVIGDGGAYLSWSPNIGRKMLVHASGPYEIEHIDVDVKIAYTNKGISGAYRGFGAPQVLFAMESLIDEVAEALHLSPVEVRRTNHLAVGKVTATGQTITGSCGLSACMEQALLEAEKRSASLPPPEPHVRRARGLSTIYYGIGYGNAIPDIGSAIAELLPDGTFTIRCGAIEYGQGLLTVFTQIACEVLSIKRHQVRIMTGDSEETPDSGSTVASRQTYVSGEAVRQACERLRSDLLKVASSHLGRPDHELTFTPDGVMGDGQLLCSHAKLQALSEKAGIKTKRQARFKASTTRLDLETGQGNAYWPYAFAAHVAEVEVDLRTGQVRLVALTAAHDVGKAINPAMVLGQVAGGANQGLGLALYEDHRFDLLGRPITRNLDTYRLPTFTDMPDVKAILIEDPEPTGPFGAKGVGEPTLVALPPAIANAVANAIGIRFRTLPIRPEDVRAALEAAGRTPLSDALRTEGR